MPRLNLSDEETGTPGGAPESDRTPMPTGLREVGGGGGRLSPIVLVILILAILGAAVFALNYFKVIHLWGKKAPVVTESFPEPDLAPVAEPTPAPAETVPVPETKVPVAKQPERAEPGIIPTGDGRFTIQFSAWQSKAKADEQASLLTAGGFDAYVDQGTMNGETWYRVRVGRYNSRADAREVIGRLQIQTEDQVYVATPRNN
jgi:cell division septation protein DedD